MSKKRPCPNSRYEIEKFESIPFDLIIEILTRLPAKSVARFRCVSKLWDSTIPSLNFTESFYTISSSRPKLLVVCVKDGETFFFSSPQPPLAANYHMSFPVNCPSGICRPVRGLVCCINQHTLNGRTITVPLICNPSTGQYLTLPRVKTRRKIVINYLGYDPIGKQFKVLCMTNKYHSPASSSEEHQVLTLGTGKKLSWRMIYCDIPHSPNIWGQGGVSDGKYDGICINGVCYYLARIHDGDKFPDIVCFDIRYEKFNCIKKAQGMMALNFGGYLEPTLINHKGKLAMLNIVSGMYTDFQLWVVEDAEKHEWSNYIYVLPPLWRLIIEEMKLRFVGTTSTSEIVLSPDCIKNSFFLLYYNLEMNTITVVDNIQGMEAFESCKAYTFLDHVENVKPMTCV